MIGIETAIIREHEKTPIVAARVLFLRRYTDRPFYTRTPWVLFGIKPFRLESTCTPLSAVPGQVLTGCGVNRIH
jgi:hypothetical protein